MKKTFVVSFALLVSLVGTAFASSTFSLAAPATLGTHKLKAGEYEVSVKKDQATITNPDGKSFTMPVRIEQAAKKFDSTSVGTQSANGVDTVSEIDLGGSTTKLIFGQ